MTIPSYERRSFSETAVATTLNGSINDTDTTINLAASTGWPTGASGDFYIRIENETIRVDTRSSNALTVLTDGRGANSTTAASHASGVAVTLVYSSFDADEANWAVVNTVGAVTAIGDILTGSAANTMQRVALGTTGLPLVAGATVPGYSQVGTAGIADDAITAAKIATDAVGSAEIAADSITTSELADDAVATANVADLAITTALINDLAVTTGKLNDDAVTAAKLASDVVDDSTLEFNGGVLRVKASGITTSHIAATTIAAGDIASDAITTAKILDANVTSAKLEASLPRGLLAAPVLKTANQGSLAGSYVDLTTLTVTVTPFSATRYLRLEAFGHFSSGTANDTLVLAILEGATELGTVNVSHVAGVTYTTARVVAYVTDATLAAHTYKVAAKTASGTGPFTLTASAAAPATFSVEDIGGH